MKCPTCGKVLDTQQGMRQHHTKVHGEPLPNRECKGCGREFYDPKARRKFCDACDPNAGRNNGNWRDAAERATCRLCGGRFVYYPSNKVGVYCSDCVASSDGFLGEAHIKPATVVEKECDHCGSDMEVLKSDLDRGEGRFCCFDCLCEWMSIDGRHEYSEYGRNWKPARRKVLERDNSECQICSKTASELGQNPDVHHILPVREFDQPEDAIL